MPKKNQPIPVNHFGNESGSGISIERLSFDNLPDIGDWEQPERHDRHSFFLLEKGSIIIEIDFERYHIKSPGAIYMHPDQVHRIISFENVTVTAWAITNEALKLEYLQLLEGISPAAPVLLNPQTFGLLCEATTLCIKISEREKDVVYQSLLKDHANALVALIIATYVIQTKTTDKLTRSELVTKAFREDLARHFTRYKRPSDYAEKLHLSPAYLNECIKFATGQAVSYHIQQRVVLEAKRLLYHSNQSLKEIAAGLGYNDYPYFSRLFTKVAGISPLAFRHKNRD
jgi:AraC family transcriptional activator of pobA